ncbi:DNA repair protein rad13 [Leucoagaricus sp. SymC.cos]|nr:DNA repair protein rad13 [Leucoagaricus sp. SymC.cos]
MAIDSSIWIYQFQATMRDKEGRALVNAHVLGFLRRITKLLFYGIKPVFVFDGGAPVLKRSTLNERKKKKSGAALSHVKIAERLLAAQMRREAVNHAQGKNPAKGKGKEKERPPEDIVLDEHTVYLEDIDGSMPKTPTKPKPVTPSSNTKKKNKYHDHDPYRLPEVDMEEAVSQATRTAAPDPRLATEDELRTFIEEMRPEDFDITSPEFRELPTEVQYEIIGDLRLKSRQTSYARLQQMLRMAPTPMDFSKQQIINLKQRNNLTQQLLVTTNSVGSAHLTIPVRIASERNKQYVLTKNEGADGGWVLAIQDRTGTVADKPILIDVEEPQPKEDDEDEDADMEEVNTTQVTDAAMDPDLRQYQREMALSAIASRYTPKKLAPLTTKPAKPIYRKKDLKPSKPLFDLDVDDDDAVAIQRAIEQMVEEEDEDKDLAFAIQASLDQAKFTPQRKVAGPSPLKPSSARFPVESPRSVGFPNARRPPGIEIFAPSGLETALSFAGTSSSRNSFGRRVSGPQERPKSAFGAPFLLSSSHSRSNSSTAVSTANENDPQQKSVQPETSAPPPVTPPSTAISGFQALTDSEDDEMEEVDVPVTLPSTQEASQAPPESKPATPAPVVLQESESEEYDDMEEVEVSIPKPAPPMAEPMVIPANISSQHTPSREPSLVPTPESHAPIQAPPSPPATTIIPAADGVIETPVVFPPTPDNRAKTSLFTWSRSPSPSGSGVAEQVISAGPTTAMTMDDSTSQELDADGQQVTAAGDRPDEEHWDAANEMDPHAEEGEFARFLSQVKGRNLNDVRREIDDEIKVLNEQRKAAMRDSEDITQQMVSQIMTMLRLFGIPYITAPMEAEAQCAELVTLGLVDGVITDDSDVFLFGAQRVYKNMFNQSKTVELFLQSDLERELGLDRDTLVRLAYLLGSDYTEGLSGAGPVVAMELLKEFPGKDGLHKYAHWWRKVQEGKDKEGESNTKFRRQFKKKFKDLYLPVDWPNPAVRDAYYHPTVDSSEEPFKWGLPDLDALRMFFNQELGWGQTKVDELLLPIIQKMNRRKTNTSGTPSGMQGSLSEWVTARTGNNFDVASLAPRKKEVYTSRRLQQVVADFRKRRKASSVAPSNSGSGSGQNDEVEEIDEEPVKKRQRKTKSGSSSRAGKTRQGKDRGRGGAAGSSGRAKKGKGRTGDDDDYSEGEEKDGGENVEVRVETPAPELRPRPRPRPVTKRNLDPAAEDDSD